MVVKLIELKDHFDRFSLQEIYINPEQVVYVRPLREKLNENFYPEGLDKRQEFSKIHLVGSPALVEQKLNGVARQLLKG